VKKYYYNLLLLLKNVNNYGVFEILKIIFYEIFFIIKFKDFSSLSYDENESDTYEDLASKVTYDTPYIPTPFYFLKILHLFFKKEKINNLLILDLGCGYSRVQYFFSTYFKTNFFGVDINKKIIKKLKNKKIKNTFFLNLNLRKEKNIELLINKTKKIKNKKKLVVFFSDSFDPKLLKNILTKLSNKLEFYCILINVKNTIYLSKKYKTLFNKEFKNPHRNIKIFKIK
jgi:SAM-dependent methyltransferase